MIFFLIFFNFLFIYKQIFLHKAFISKSDDIFKSQIQTFTKLIEIEVFLSSIRLRKIQYQSINGIKKYQIRLVS